MLSVAQTDALQWQHASQQACHDASAQFLNLPLVHRLDSQQRKRLDWELRVYMAGLSDEAGAAQPLAMAVKQLGQPSLDQVGRWVA
jgi:hypothetical protein